MGARADRVLGEHLMASAHWSIPPDLLTWVRAESKRLGRSTSEVVTRILYESKIQEQTIVAPSVAAWLEAAQYDDTSAEEQRVLGAAVALIRERWQR